MPTHSTSGEKYAGIYVSSWHICQHIDMSAHFTRGEKYAGVYVHTFVQGLAIMPTHIERPTYMSAYQDAGSFSARRRLAARWKRHLAGETECWKRHLAGETECWKRHLAGETEMLWASNRFEAYPPPSLFRRWWGEAWPQQFDFVINCHCGDQLTNDYKCLLVCVHRPQAQAKLSPNRSISLELRNSCLASLIRRRATVIDNRRHLHHYLWRGDFFMQTRLTYLSFMVNKKMCVSFFVQYMLPHKADMQTTALAHPT